MPDTAPPQNGAPLRNLIQDGALHANPWRLYAPPEDDARALPPDEPHWLVPLKTWQAGGAALRERVHPVAVLLQPSEDPVDLLEGGARTIDPRGIAFIAVDFPVYTDGRGYSIARWLRTRYGWRGDMRAVGDVLIDTIHYQARCGFTSFVVKEGHDPERALHALATFSVHYQRGYEDVAAAA
jgi:uncharacterized protein (DUF934 family)